MSLRCCSGGRWRGSGNRKPDSLPEADGVQRMALRPYASQQHESNRHQHDRRQCECDDEPPLIANRIDLGVVIVPTKVINPDLLTGREARRIGTCGTRHYMRDSVRTLIPELRTIMRLCGCASLRVCCRLGLHVCDYGALDL